MSLRLRLDPRLGNVLEANRVKAAISHIVSALFENELVVRCVAGCLVAVRWCAETRRQSIMLTFVYSWPAPFWSGAAIDIVLITTRLWQTKAAWQTIRKVTIHHSIPPRVLSQWGYGASLITKGKTVVSKDKTKVPLCLVFPSSIA